MKKILFILTLSALVLSSQANAAVCNCKVNTPEEEECSTIKEFFGKCEYQIERKKILEDLQLTEDQTEQVNLLLKQKDKKVKPLKKELKKLNTQKEEMVSQKASDLEIAAQNQKIASVNNQIDDINKNFTKSFNRILTRNQKIKLYEIKIKKIMDNTLDVFMEECDCSSAECKCKEGCDCGCKDAPTAAQEEETIDLNSIINTIFTPQQQQQIKEQSKQIQQQVKDQSIKLQQQFQQQINSSSQDFHKEVQKQLDNVQRTLNCSCDK